ncbi:MAG: prepilin-type N-terminal cleavage/methylation domain-containing protein [Sulfurimonas sp.]|nr:prepilin-type N-terminal cleavage/methylation domain-containing protein [Sulfurimonas sp.]
MKIRAAFTLIELIFAIVVMSIVVLSLPMMSQVISSGIEKNLVQEAVLVTSGDILKTISGKFDENSRTDDENYEKILYSSDAEVIAIDGNGSRAGNINIIFDNNTTLRPTLSGLDGVETVDNEDDVDDYSITDGYAVTESGSGAGYKQLYKKSIIITQKTFNGVNDANAKKVEVTFKNEDATEELVKMHTYTFNTGSVSVSPYRDLP